MATFLERYQNGDREAVWDELVALGVNVREEPFYADARAVARETMQRARANVEMLHQRLTALDYRFEYPNEAVQPPAPDAAAGLDEFERVVGQIPLSLRAWCEIVGEVNFIGNHPSLAFYGSRAAARAPVHKPLPALKPGNPLQAMMKSLEAMNPALLQQVQQQVAAAAAPQPEKANGSPVLSDPLVVQAARELSLDVYREWQEDQTEADDDEESDPFYVTVAPDVYHKANTSGGAAYEINLPNAAADALLLNEAHHTTFVAYLRIAFHWGGFPGLEGKANPDEGLLRSLREGLLPI